MRSAWCRVVGAALCYIGTASDGRRDESDGPRDCDDGLQTRLGRVATVQWQAGERTLVLYIFSSHLIVFYAPSADVAAPETFGSKMLIPPSTMRPTPRTPRPPTNKYVMLCYYCMRNVSYYRSSSYYVYSGGGSLKGAILIPFKISHLKNK